MSRRLGAALLALLLFDGCFRTVYRNLQPPNAPPVVETPTTLATNPRSSWQSFFVYGWFPSERPIDAAQQCGGDAHVAAIETGQSFGQALIEIAALLVTGAGILVPVGVYAPWSAQVSCDHSPPH